MKKLLLTLCLLAAFQGLMAQHSMLLLKRGTRTVSTHWEGSTIAFQLSNGSWQQGRLLALRHDSVFLQTEIVRYYAIGNDTLRLPVQGYPMATITAWPHKGTELSLRGGEYVLAKNGSTFGKLLCLGAAGYTVLSLVNGLRENGYSVKEHGTDLAIAGAAFATGFAINKLQRYAYKLGGKYHLEVINLDAPK